MVVTKEPADTNPTRTKPLALRTNFIWTILGSFVFGATNLGMQMALAKMGTKEILAEYILGATIAQPVMQFSQLNLRAVVSTDTHNEYAFPHYFWLRLILTSVSVAVIAALAGVGPYAATARAVIVITGIGMAFDSIGDIIYGSYQRAERLDRMGLSMTVKGILSLILLIVFLLIGHNAVWAIAGSALASVIVVSCYDIPCGWWFARSKGDVAVKVTPVSLLQLAWLALPLGVTMLFNSLYANFPRYFLVNMHRVTDLAYLAAPGTAMAMGVYMVSIFSQPLSPRLARAGKTGDRRQFLRLFGMLALFVWILGAAIVAISILGGRQLITIFFSRVYANHFDVFEWMMVATAISYASLVCGTGITSLRRFKVQLYWSGSVAIVSFISSWILVPRHGIVGVAMAICATMTARLLIGYGFLAWAISKMEPMSAEPASVTQAVVAAEGATE